MPHARAKPLTQQRLYGVLVGSIRDGQEDPAGHSPHYEIWVEADRNYRIAVNGRSVDGSDVLAHYDPNFTDPTKLGLAALAAGAKGFTGLTTGPGEKGLDYLRDGLFPIDAMAPIPPDGQGVTLSNLLDGQVERAKSRSQCRGDRLWRILSGSGPRPALRLRAGTGRARHSYDARQQRQFR